MNEMIIKMKILILILPAIFFEGFTFQTKESLSIKYINQYDMIAIGSLDETSAINGLVIKIEKVFKGCVDRYVVVNPASEIVINKNESYLIYATLGANGAFQIAANSRSASVSKAEDDLKFLESNISCFNREVIGQGACPRSYKPICGCDGNGYCNCCEASKKGIAVYSYGLCKDSQGSHDNKGQ
jgi:hypothetical protein